tara:strand:- start:854 stop:1033 length:180 start_codon:yes stop_codon:yes gene_type:complete
LQDHAFPRENQEGGRSVEDVFFDDWKVGVDVGINLFVDDFIVFFIYSALYVGINHARAL